MVELKEILKGVNDSLKKAFPLVTLDSRDLSEGITRPSFKTELDSLNTEYLEDRYKIRNFVVRIYYFAQAGRIEKLEILEKLEELFKFHLEVKENFFIPVDELRMEETDGVLIASFDSYTYEELPQPEIETMEELEISKGV